MQIAFRWYGGGNGQLSDIQQIPGAEGIVWALHDKMPGEIWQPEEIAGVKKQLDEYGFNMDVVESVASRPACPPGTSPRPATGTATATPASWTS